MQRSSFPHTGSVNIDLIDAVPNGIDQQEKMKKSA